MISRSTLVGALVVAELAILGMAAKAVAGGGTYPAGTFRGPDLAGGWSHGGPATAYDRTFAAGHAPHVVIDVNDVHVVVQAANVPGVHVLETIRKVGYVSGDIPPVTASQTADGVRVATARNAGVFLIGDLVHEVRVTVPPGAQIEVLSGGRVETSGLRAKLIAHIDDGAIHVSDHQGDLDVSTADGRIYLTDVQGGTLAAKSDDGRLVFTRVGADHIDAHTNDGRIEAKDVRAVDGAMGTHDGPVTISFTASSDATVDAHTADGHVRAHGVATSDSDGTHATVRLGSGRGSFEVSSDDGSISITQGASI